MTAASILALPAIGCLYRIIFTNGKSYIGITSRTAELRFAEHVACSRGEKYRSAVHRALSKYGDEATRVETLVVADWEYLKALEVRAIAAYGTRPPFGYNLTLGGEGVVGFDAVTRAKMGAANIGRKPSVATLAKLKAASTGRLHGRTAREKISAARIGMKFSEDHRQKLSTARRDFVASGKPHLTPEGRARLSVASRAARLGVPRSEETKRKLSAANMGKTASAETRAKQSAALKGRARSPEIMVRIVATRLENKLARKAAGILDERVSAWTGKRHRSESIEKMRASHVGRVVSIETRAKLSASIRRPEILARISPLGRAQSAETIAKRVSKLVGQKRSDEVKVRMSAAQTGKKASDETKAKIGAASASRTHSAETRAKMALAQTGKVRTSEQRTRMSAARAGEKHGPMSDDTKAKISAAHKGKKKSPEAVKNQLAARAANRLARAAAPPVE